MKFFNGAYTIVSVDNSAVRRTFEIATQEEGAEFMPGKRILSLLTGSNNEGDWTGFAFVDDRGIAVWRKKRGVGKKSEFERYAEMLAILLANPPNEDAWTRTIDFGGGVSRRYQVLAEKTCARCNRRLTTPESIRTGLGPICATKA